MKGKSSKKTLMPSMSRVDMAILLISIAFTFLAVTPVIVAQEVDVKVIAPEEVEKGETFEVTIDVGVVTALLSGQFDLSFDSRVVEVTDVADGSLDGETIPVLMWDFVDSDTIRVILLVSGAEGVNGSGYLAKVGLKATGEGGDKSVLDISDGFLFNNEAEEIEANWIDATVKIEEGEEEVEEEVTPGSPVITGKPAEAAVGNAVGESRIFNATVNQIADISWQINGTEVQTNESVTEAVFTNKSAVIGTWNISAIATNTTTELSDMHTWIWSVATTAITPTPTLAPGETPKPATPTPTLASGETPKPATPTPTLAPGVTPKPTTPTPIPTPKPPGFEAIFAIAVMSAIAYILLKRR
jgi:cell division septation protein DedD